MRCERLSKVSSVRILAIVRQVSIWGSIMSKEISESSKDETPLVLPNFDVLNLLGSDKLPAKPASTEDRNAMEKPSVKDAPKDGKEGTPASKNEVTAYDVKRELVPPAKPAQAHEDRNAMDKTSVKDAPKDGKEGMPAQKSELKAYDVKKESVPPPAKPEVAPAPREKSSGFLDCLRDGLIPIVQLRSVLERLRR